MNQMLSQEQFVLFDGPTWADPWPIYQQLQESSPIHYAADGDYWILTRHRQVAAAVRDWKSYSSANGVTVRYNELAEIGLTDNPPLVMTDPPGQTAFRKLVSRGFTPRQVTELAPIIQEFCHQKISALKSAGSGDIVTELFKPLPSLIVGHYLGVPSKDQAVFDRWTENIVAANAQHDQSIVAESIGEILSYFTELIKYRRKHPAADTVSQLVTAGLDLSDEGILSILAFAFTMIAGGNDTTTGLLGAGVQMLSNHPEQRKQTLANLDSAVEELLRLTSPVQGLARTTTCEIEVAGQTIPAGKKVLLLFAAANRDPRMYGPKAAELDVTRNPAQILSFSLGTHHCLGASAARLAAKIALTELLTQIPDFSVDPTSITWAAGNYVRRPLTTSIQVESK